MKSKYKKLEQLYKKIPQLECKGLCHESCTIIMASKIEIKRVKERLKGKNPFNPALYLNQMQEAETVKIPVCSMLKENRCSIYSIRPAICRMYGAAEGLECPFGCQPKRKLSPEEGRQLLKDIEAL